MVNSFTRQAVNDVNVKLKCKTSVPVLSLEETVQQGDGGDGGMRSCWKNRVDGGGGRRGEVGNTGREKKRPCL